MAENDWFNLLWKEKNKQEQLINVNNIAQDTTHRFTTDAEKANWNEKLSKTNAMATMSIYRDLANYDNNAGAIVGTIKITFPMSWTGVMMSFDLDGYNYDANGHWKLLIGGYNYTGSSWVNTSAKLLSSAPFTQVRFGHDGTKCCILLGTTATTWQFPKIVLSKLIAGYSNWTGLESGWGISLITSEVGITVSSTITV